MFSEQEVNYLKSQRLARLATVSRRDQPDVVPVGFEFDGKYFWVGSHDQNIFFRSKKYLNVMRGNDKVAVVIDDLETIDPWKPRFIKVYGKAEVMDRNGRFGPGKYLRITPDTSWSWGVEGTQPSEGDFRTKTIHHSS